jgi:hypothetical protein
MIPAASTANTSRPKTVLAPQETNLSGMEMTLPQGK